MQETQETWVQPLGREDPLEKSQNFDLLPGKGNGNPFQYSCLENSVDRGAWWAIQSMESQRVWHNWAYMHIAKIAKNDSCWHMAAPTQYCKAVSVQLKINKNFKTATNDYLKKTFLTQTQSYLSGKNTKVQSPGGNLTISHRITYACIFWPRHLPFRNLF